MSNEEILETYARGLSSEGKNRGSVLRYAGAFLEYAEGEFSRQKIDGFIEKLRIKHKYSDGTINFIFRTLRTMFLRNKIDWPYRRGEAPRIREDRIEAAALNPATVGRMIAAIKENGTPEEQAFLALSTTYGLRRIEMVGIEANDIKGKTIHIATVKHGRERTHLVPEMVAPWLAGYDFSKEISEAFIFRMWYRIEYSIRFPHTNRVGWHSIRRSLDTMLMRELPESVVMSFMRWKQRTSSNMAYRYSAIKFIGEEGETTELVGDALDVDNQVFAVHPFINFWR